MNGVAYDARGNPVQGQRRIVAGNQSFILAAFIHSNQPLPYQNEMIDNYLLVWLHLILMFTVLVQNVILFCRKHVRDLTLKKSREPKSERNRSSSKKRGSGKSS